MCTTFRYLLFILATLGFCESLIAAEASNSNSDEEVHFLTPRLPSDQAVPKSASRPRQTTLPNPNYQSSFEKVSSSEIPKIGDNANYRGTLHEQRTQFHAEMDQLTQSWEAKIPDSAYHNGKLDVTDPGYLEIKQQWQSAADQLKGKYDVYNANRNALHNEVSNVKIERARGRKLQSEYKITDASGKVTYQYEAPELGALFESTGRMPDTLHGDIDLTPLKGYEEAATLYAREMAKRGKRVLDLPDRYVILDTDTTVWKSRSFRDQAGSASAWGDALFSSSFKSDKFSTPGGLHYTSNGKFGSYDPEGAVLDNIKKFMDGYRSGGSLDDVDWKLICKSATKIQKITGIEVDPKLQQVLDKVRISKNTLKEADLFTFGVKSDGLEAEKLKRIEELVDVVKRGYAKSVEMSNNVRGDALDDLAGSTLSTRAKQDLRLARTDIEFTNQAVKQQLIETDPEGFSKLTGGAPVEKTLLPDGSEVFYFKGKAYTKSQWVDLSMQGARARFDTLFPALTKDVKFLSTQVRPSLAVADLVIQIATLYSSANRGHAEAIATMRDDENPLWTVSRGTGYALLDWIGYTPIKGLMENELDTAFTDQWYRKLKANGYTTSADVAAHLKGTTWGLGKMLWGLVDPIDKLVREEIPGWLEAERDLQESQKWAEDHAQRVAEYENLRGNTKQIIDDIWALLNGDNKGEMTREESEQLKHDQVQEAWEAAKLGDHPDISYREFLRGFNPYTQSYDPKFAALMPPLPEEKNADKPAEASPGRQPIEFEMTRRGKMETHRGVQQNLNALASLHDESSTRWLRDRSTFDTATITGPRYTPAQLIELGPGFSPQNMRESKERARLCPECRDAPVIRVQALFPNAEGQLLGQQEFSLGWSLFTGSIDERFKSKVLSARQQIAFYSKQKNEAINKGNLNLAYLRESSKGEIPKVQAVVAHMDVEIARLRAYLEFADTDPLTIYVPAGYKDETGEEKYIKKALPGTSEYQGVVNQINYLTVEKGELIPRKLAELKTLKERIIARREKAVVIADSAIMEQNKRLQESQHQATKLHQHALADDPGDQPPANSAPMSILDPDLRIVQARLYGLHDKHNQPVRYQLHYFPAYPMWADQISEPMAWLKFGKALIPVNKTDDRLLLRFTDMDDDTVLAEYEIPLLGDRYWQHFRDTEPLKWARLWHGLNQQIQKVAVKHDRKLRNHQAATLLRALKRMYLSQGQAPDRNYFIDAGLGDEFDQTVQYTANKLKQPKLASLELIDRKWEELFSLLTSRFHDLRSRLLAEQKKPLPKPKPAPDDGGYNPLFDPAIADHGQPTSGGDQLAGLVDQFGAGIGTHSPNGNGKAGSGQTGQAISEKYRESNHGQDSSGSDPNWPAPQRGTAPDNFGDQFLAAHPGSAANVSGNNAGSVSSTSQPPAQCQRIMQALSDWARGYKSFNDFLHQQGRKRLPYWAPAQLSSTDLATARRLINQHMSILNGVIKCLGDRSVLASLDSASRAKLQDWSRDQEQTSANHCKEVGKMLSQGMPSGNSAPIRQKMQDLGIREDRYTNYWTAQQENCQQINNGAKQVSQLVR